MPPLLLVQSGQRGRRRSCSGVLNVALSPACETELILPHAPEPAAPPSASTTAPFLKVTRTEVTSYPNDPGNFATRS